MSPKGCKDCVHVFADRCGLTGHVAHYQVNAPHHCKEFKRDTRNRHTDNLERRSDSGRPVLHLRRASD